MYTVRGSKMSEVLSAFAWHVSPLRDETPGDLPDVPWLGGHVRAGMRTGVPSLCCSLDPLTFRWPQATPGRSPRPHTQRPFPGGWGLSPSTPRALHTCSPRCRGNPGIRKNYEAMASVQQDQLLLVMLTHSFIHSFNIS